MNIVPSLSAGVMPLNATLGDWGKQTRTVHVVLTDLPDEILRGVGTIVTLWAHEEWLLLTSLRRLMASDPKLGRRIEGGSSRAKAITDKIRPLLLDRRIAHDLADWNALVGEITECDKRRNLVGHGVWFRNDFGRLCVQHTKGTWHTAKGVAPLSKSDYPEALEINVAWIENTVMSIKKVIERTLPYYDAVKAKVANRSDG